jgi:Linalool dehydratase/isomerase
MDVYPADKRRTRWAYVRATFAVLLASAIWLPLLPYLHDPTGDEPRLLLRATIANIGHHEQWRAESKTLRRGNPEWDLMRRTFTALALAEAAYPGANDGATAASALGALDKLVDELRADLESAPDAQFLLPYAQDHAFLGGGRSLFVDGEVALILESRLLLGGRLDLVPLANSRLDQAIRAMSAAPNLSAESYPDEAWTFCNTTALAAIRLHDARTHEEHRDLAERWIAHAKVALVERSTGLLVSRYRMNDVVMEGPEGSSIFMIAHNLALWDPAFARDQYERAKSQLIFHVLGFGLAREWPVGNRDTHQDVDSGPVVPLLDASPGASGLALLGATTFHDESTQKLLMRSLRIAAIPRNTPDGMTYLAAGPMGNAVALRALNIGALWRSITIEPTQLTTGANR